LTAEKPRLGLSFGSRQSRAVNRRYVLRQLIRKINGVTSTLLAHAAEVVLTERRRLVLIVRETPLMPVI
jgi:hypothetical protein